MKLYRISKSLPQYFTSKFLFGLFISFCLYTNCNAQDSEKKISYNCKKCSIQKIIIDLKNLTGINFSYNPNDLPLDEIVSIKKKKASISEILSELFSERNIEFVLIEKQYVLKRNKTENIVREKTVEKKKTTICGYVRDKSNGEALIGATVYLRNTTIGTTTNAYGFYSLSFPEGNHQIGFSFIGYKTVFEDFQGNSNRIVELEPLDLKMQEVEIKASESKTDSLNLFESVKKMFIMRPHQLEFFPAFAGDMDIIKSFQSIPGVKSFGDGSSFFNVRGGNRDQNLILVDEAPIFNPSHLLGFFTSLSPDAINKAEITKGDYSSKYGGRLSSVMEIHTKEGNLKRWGLSGNFGFFTSSISAEGPLMKDKMAIFSSFRRSNLDWLTGSLNKQNLSLGFIDFNLKINTIINHKNRIFLNLYAGNDDILAKNTVNYKSFGMQWKNGLGSLRWNHIFNKKLFMNLTLYSSKYNYKLFLTKELDAYWESSISTTGIKNDYTWYLKPEFTFRFGFDGGTINSNPGNITLTDAANQKYVPEVFKYNSRFFNFYFQTEHHLAARLSLDYGVRFSTWGNYGPTSVFYFNELHKNIDTIQVEKNKKYSSFLNVEPRFKLKYKLDEYSGIYIGYSRNVQYIQQISNSTSSFHSLEVWVPAGPNIEPQKCDQINTGLFFPVLKNKISVLWEIFGKNFTNTIDFNDHANLLFNPLLEGEIRSGNAHSFGSELMIKKDDGIISWWLAYSWSRALMKVNEINGGNTYPSLSDKPHELNLFISFKPTKRWVISTSFTYSSGTHYTKPVSFYYYNGYQLPIYSDKHNATLPDYHRLDLFASFRLNKISKRFNHYLILNIYNVYNQRNLISINTNKTNDSDGNWVIPANQDASYQITPTGIAVAGIIPCLTYKFNF